MSDSAVLIFARTPLPGRVKTRLIPALGVAGATQLYSGLLRREIEWIARETPYDIELWVTPDESHPLLQELSHRYALRLYLQQGEDLGARMGYAAEQALRRHQRVLLLGVDCPALTATHLKQAVSWLEAGEDAVLGPAEDGGYVLLGLKRFHPTLFRGHTWGGADVAQTTRQAMRRIGWCWRELPLLWDLDRPHDLAQFQTLGIEIPSSQE
jgi:rSAM/selenodomain-associated transferase 1